MAQTKIAHADIDISIDNLCKLYPVTDVFRSKQKANNSRLIQIEHIDKSFYRARSNCTSFITSNKRVHAWISAVIYNGEGKKNSNVAWIDKKDNHNNIVQTEFVVSDKNSDFRDDDLMYKVLIYLTTGNILIQGKNWELVCDNEFSACKSLVDLYVVQSPKNPDTESITKNSETSIPKELEIIRTDETVFKTVSVDCSNDNTEAQQKKY